MSRAASSLVCFFARSIAARTVARGPAATARAATGHRCPAQLLLIASALSLSVPGAAAAESARTDADRVVETSIRAEEDGSADVDADAGGPRWRQPLPTANAALLGFLVGGTVGGAALLSSTAFAVNALVLSVGTGAGSAPPPPLTGALMMAGFYGAPLLILTAGAGAVLSVAAALWWGDVGWLSMALGAGGLLVAGALAVPIAVMASTMLAMTVVAPVTNWQGALGPAGTLMMTTGMVGASIVVVSVAGGLVLGAVTAGTAAVGAGVSEALE